MRAEVGDDPDLLLALGRCQLSDGVHRPAWRSLLRARTLYGERDDHEKAAEATLVAIRVPSPLERRLGLIDEDLSALPPEESVLEVRLRLERLLAAFGGRTAEMSREELAEAEEVERLVSGGAEPRAEASLRFLQAQQAQFVGDWAQAISLLHDAQEQLSVVGDVERLSETLAFEGFISLGSGSVESGVAAAERGLAHARRYRLRFAEANACSGLGMLSIQRGDLIAARGYAAQAAALTRHWARRSSLPCTPGRS